MSNEAAERLRAILEAHGRIKPIQCGAEATDLDAALAAERKATVERIPDAIHYALCDVSHHDAFTVCKNRREYEMIGASVNRFLDAEKP